MDSINPYEARFQSINRIFVPVYVLMGLAAALLYGLKGDFYHCPLALGTLLVPVGLSLFYRLFRLRRVHQLDFWVLIFATLAYMLGSVAELYLALPGYDKLAHMLSGVFVGMLCLCLLRAVRPGRELNPEDTALALLFVFFGSMAVAGLWEVGEYYVYRITGRDVQRVAATGVNDTMQDMIVCLVGTLAYLPQVSAYCRGKRGVMNSLPDAFFSAYAGICH